jgi:predicted glycosyltransferase involved in capsule biosynthesis
MQLRLDSIDRLVNLKTSLKFIKEHFNTDVHILEADSFDNSLIRCIAPDMVHYRFIEDNDPIFYRTKYINTMVEECTTPYFAVWEPDIIVPPEQVAESVNFIRSGEADFVNPYEYVLDTTLILRKHFIINGDWRYLDKHNDKMQKMYVSHSVGGVFFCNRERFIEAGMDNLNIYGWGMEDVERVSRWKKLGYSYKRADGYIYHLSHQRGPNSYYDRENDYIIKHFEISRIERMTKTELENEIAGWKQQHI